MILTVTPNPALDKSTSVKSLVAEQKMRCAPPHLDPGGGGINVSRVINRLGGSTTALYLAGGHTGDTITQLLEKECITCVTVSTEHPTRENFIVVDTATNQQYRFGMEGAAVAQQEWTALLAAAQTVPQIEYIVGSGSLPMGVPVDFYARLAHTAKQRGTRYVLDTSGEALRAALSEGGAYLLKPNIAELSALVGAQTLELEQVAEAARSLISKGTCQVVAVSLGAAGALLVSHAEQHRVVPPVVKKKSTVGAGDSMVAGMTLGLSNNWPLAEVIRYGVACGTAATMNAGTELCHPSDVERLLNQVALF